MKSPHNNMCIFLSMEMVRGKKWTHLNKPITIWNFPELSFPKPRNRAHDVVKTNPQRGRNGLLRVFSRIECELEHKRRWVLLPCFVSHCLEVSFVDASVALSLARMSSAAMLLQTILLQHRDQNWRDYRRWGFFCPAFCRRIPVVSSVPWASYHLLRLRLVFLAARPAPSLVSLKRYWDQRRGMMLWYVEPSVTECLVHS